MRCLIYLSLLALLTTCSCKKEERRPLACAPNARMVKEVAGATGTVIFLPALSRYTIVQAQPGTYDVVNIGVLCAELPEDLRIVNTRVVFSGTYYEYDQPSQVLAPAGTAYYYLALADVKAE